MLVPPTCTTQRILPVRHSQPCDNSTTQLDLNMPLTSSKTCLVELVARGGIEPPTFRFSDGTDCGTSPFVLVRLDKVDQYAVVEPVVLRLTADNRRTDSTPTEGLDTVHQQHQQNHRPISVRAQIAEEGLHLDQVQALRQPTIFSDQSTARARKPHGTCPSRPRRARSPLVRRGEGTGLVRPHR